MSLQLGFQRAVLFLSVESRVFFFLSLYVLNFYFEVVLTALSLFCFYSSEPIGLLITRIFRFSFLDRYNRELNLRHLEIHLFFSLKLKIFYL